MKQGRGSRLLLWICLACGLLLLAYPTLSDRLNQWRENLVLESYGESIEAMEEDESQAVWRAAEQYNTALRTAKDRFSPTEAEHRAYLQLLDPQGHGVMCQLEIPEIGVSLPVYHGVDEGVLQVAVGHLEGSSLPVGGKGTHCVLTGHRGLPSARLLSDLDQLEVGDRFTLHTLGTDLCYQVEEVLVVEPDELDALAIREGEDLCTLLTCTPYGVNTHRLLVRGRRVERP